MVRAPFRHAFMNLLHILPGTHPLHPSDIFRVLLLETVKFPKLLQQPFTYR